MVPPLELQNELSARIGPGQADGRHYGLGSGTDEPYAFQRRNRPLKRGGERYLVRVGTSKAQPPGGLGSNRPLNAWVRVAKDHRPVGENEIDIAVPFDIDQEGASRVSNEKRRTSDFLKRPDRAVHTAWNQSQGRLE